MTTLIAHDFTVGEILTAATMDGMTADDGTLNSDKAEVKAGTYTGNGATSYAITGIGFAPTYVKIWENDTTDGNSVHIFETTSDYVDNHANGMCLRHQAAGGHVVLNHAIIALGSDGFTVDDRSIDNHPNQSGTTYNYVCYGAG